MHLQLQHQYDYSHTKTSGKIFNYDCDFVHKCYGGLCLALIKKLLCELILI